MESTKKKNSRSELPGALLFIALAAAFGFFRVRYGLSFGDEGHSLSVPLRYSLGDIPFRDEILNPLRWFDILLWPFMRLLPESGAVLLLREVALGFHLLCFGALVYAFGGGRTRNLVSGALFFAAVYSITFSFWTPTYHSASSDFIFLGLALWLMGVNSRAKKKALLFGVGSGMAFFLMGVCELPLFALIALPLFLSVRALKKSGRDNPVFISSASLCAITAFLAVCSFAALRFSGLSADLFRAVGILRSDSFYSAGVSRRIIVTSKYLLYSMPYLAFHAAFWGLVAAPRLLRMKNHAFFKIFSFSSTFIVPAVYAAISALIIYSNVKTGFYRITFYFEGMFLLSVFIFPLVLRFSNRSKEDKFFYSILFVFTVFWHLILAAICNNGVITASLLTMPLALVLAGAGAIHLTTPPRFEAEESALPDKPRVSNSAPVMSMLFFTGVFFLAANLFSMSNYDWIWKFDGKFESGKLQGIYLKQELVGSTEAVCDFLKPRLKKGDFLLSFYSDPMLHYLTETRAALPTGFPNLSWPEKTRARFIREMIARRRVPRYAVSFGEVYREPIYDFVRRNYRPVVRFGPYVVWEHY